MKRSESVPAVIYDLKDDLDKGKLTRREFIRLACMMGMSAAAAGQMAEMLCPSEVFAGKPKQGGSNSGKTNKNSHQIVARRGRENQVLGKSGKPLLIIVEGSEIDAMVTAGLEAMGGLDRVIGNQRKVILKPNTNQRDPFPSTTAPETMRAVAHHCRIAGAEQIVVHEDHKSELALYYKPEQLPGVDIEIIHAPDVSYCVLVEYQKWHGDMDMDEALKNATGRGRMARRLQQPGIQWTEGPRLRVAKILQEAPVIINMPVLKRHFAGQITSALKNHFGSVYGLHRWLAHASLKTNREYFDRKLTEFASAVRPELTITDIRSLQAVSGPRRGSDTKIVEGVNRLVITGDMIAADVVAMDLMKRYDNTFTPANEAIVRRQHAHAEEQGIGTSDLSKLEIIEVKV